MPAHTMQRRREIRFERIGREREKERKSKWKRNMLVREKVD